MLRHPIALLLLLAASACSSPPPLRNAISAAPRNEDLPQHELVYIGPAELRSREVWQPGSDPASLNAMGRLLESRAVRAPGPFRSLLPSWNVDVAPGAGFAVEVQVRGDEWDWSPWLYVGDWGVTGDPARRTLQFEHGRVAVDVLELDRPATWYRWRLRGLGGAGSISIRRFAIAFEGEQSLSGHNPSDDAGKPIALDVPARSQRVEGGALAERICSPTSVAMALEHFGSDRPTSAVAALLYDADHDIYGNWNRAVQGAFELGVSGYLERHSNWTQVRSSLLKGHVLVIRVAAEPGELEGAPYPRTDGHLLVLRGLDGAGGVLCNDPAAASPAEVQRTYSCEDLERTWMSKGGVAYVFTGPRSGFAAAQ